MPPQYLGGPKLPRTILDQIQGPGASRSKAGRPTTGPRNRKDRRKLERVQKRTQSRSFRSNPQVRSVAQQSGSESESDDEEAHEAVQRRPVAPPTPVLERPAGRGNAAISEIPSAVKKSRPDVELPENKKPAKQSRRAAEEDAEIAALEAKLGLRGKTKLPKAFQDDGLDVLLDGLSEGSDAERELGSKSKDRDDDLWLQRKRRKLEGGLRGASSDESEDQELDGGIDSGSELFSEEDSDTDKAHDEPFADIPSVGGKSNSTAQKRVRENPYIAPVTQTSTASEKYIPPSLRPTSSDDTEAASRLRRQMVGLLNRLSDANIVSILADVEKLYQSHPRQLVTATIIDILIELISDRTALNDTFIVLHAGFIAAVYKIVGTDFGAQIVERIVDRLDTYQEDQNDGGKVALNLISLLDRLYMFQVIGCALIFDYIRAFLLDLSETNTELLLRITRDVGPQLRQDDPSSLKDIVLILQKSVSKLGETNLSVRTKFMIESINDLKNNRMKTGVAAHNVINEHTTRMKKTLGSLNSRTIKAGEPLRIGLADIRDTEKKGKWWLVGASWKGGEQQSQQPQSLGEDTLLENGHDTVDDGTTDLLQIAREQRMNTDIRRAIFISIMSASDYKDAHVRLVKLRLKKSQQLEIPRVLLHCASAEQQYNPYYTLIATKLCAEHKLKMAFKFALWDLFKRMGESGDFGESADVDDEDAEGGLADSGIVNLAKLYAHLVTHDLLGLEILKAVDLLHLQPKTTIFVEVLLVSIIVQSGKDKQVARSLERIFINAKQVEGLSKGLGHFLRKVVMRSDLMSGKSETATRAGCKVAIRALSEGSTALGNV